jgi:tRNA G18 (ribose-2'-O)-methylase SpoU
MNTNSVTFFDIHKINPIPKKNALILAVWEIGNPENIGMIIRLAHNVGAQKVLFVNEKINFRDSKIKKIAGFSFEQMEWEFISQEDFFKLLGTEYQLIVLETCDGSKNIYDTNLPDKTIILAGSESRGLPENIIEKSDKQIHIPMPGGCKSMNISHALSVAAFEWYRQKTVNK